MPGQLRHAAAWLKALSHEAALRLRVPPPATAGPRDHLDAAQRIAASVVDRAYAYLYRHPYDYPLPCKPRVKCPREAIIQNRPRQWQVVPP
jgi:hypothetical protein